LLGWSVQHRRIDAQIFGKGSNVIVVIGGTHGNEPSSAQLVQRLAKWMAQSWNASANDKVILIPALNPDGLALDQRTNARGVDLNRNFPTSDWGQLPRRKGDRPGPRPGSEPETNALVSLLAREHPCRIITVHAPYHQINVDGPAMAIAKKMSQLNHTRITKSIGYATPGSLGTFAGKERGIPTVTLELGRESASSAWKSNKDALLVAINTACSG
jgi:predicted deacylase